MKRPFRGLRRQPPRAHYDAVVIGAGIGGLMTANLLAREGLSVLLVEQHYMVGGYCSTFRRAGYTFDASTHFYPLLGNPETLSGRVLAAIGSQTRWIEMDPIDTFHLPDGSRFEVPKDFDTYRARLDAAFPASREALDAFFAEVRKAYTLGLLSYFRDRPTDRLGRLRDLTVREVLDQHFTDPKLKLILTADCPHWGSPPDRTSFVFDAMLRLSYFLGNYYPVGGSQAFADDLARCFETQGGEILMSSQVERIVVEDGAARGIEAETLRGPLRGRYRITADAVISNADLRTTWERMLDGATLPSAARDLQAETRRLRPSLPCFLSFIGLRDVDADVLESAQGYYWANWDSDRLGRDALICKIFVPTHFEPRMAPPGGQIVILQKVLDMDYHAVSDWPQHKTAIETQVTDQLAKVIPGIRDKIVVQESSSAATAERFTLNAEGAMLGWEMSPSQLGEARPGVESPLPNLFHVGHWVRPGGGITPVIVSALRAAEAVTGHAPALPTQPRTSPTPIVAG